MREASQPASATLACLIIQHQPFPSASLPPTHSSSESPQHLRSKDVCQQTLDRSTLLCLLLWKDLPLGDCVSGQRSLGLESFRRACTVPDCVDEVIDVDPYTFQGLYTISCQLLCVLFELFSTVSITDLKDQEQE